MTAAASPTALDSPALFLADHAAVESGKLYIHGGFWSRLNFPSFPAALNFAVAATIRVPWHDHKQHEFVIRFENADGEQIGGTISGNFAAGTAPDAREGEAAVLPLAAVINNFVFERAGDFSAILEVDGEVLNRWPFRVVHQLMPFNPIDPANLPRM
jgi:hypothetical protein